MAGTADPQWTQANPVCSARRERGGLRRENGEVFRERLLAVGGSVDPLEAFRAVRGRDADPTPLLRRRGLLPASP